MSQEEFNKALLAAQQEFPSIGKGRTANIETTKGSYSYTYADLGDILEAVLPILHKHGIALSQSPVSPAGMVGVQTRLLHESGHVEDCGALLLSSGNNPQAAGSAMTYARRYAVCAALGVVADEDDDGRAASQPAETKERLQNRLKVLAMDLSGGDVELAKTLYESDAPVEWTVDAVEDAEAHMREVLGATEGGYS